MISQEYLTLLNNLQSVDSPDIDRAWKSFVYDWHNDGDLEYTLTQLARHCLSEMAVITSEDRNRLETRFSAIRDVEMVNLHKAKNAGYSGNNTDPWHNMRACNVFGIDPIDGCLTRMCDKYQRLTNITQYSELEQVGEDVREVCRDLGSYSLMLICLLREKRYDSLSDYEYAHAI